MTVYMANIFVAIINWATVTSVWPLPKSTSIALNLITSMAVQYLLPHQLKKPPQTKQKCYFHQQLAILIEFFISSTTAVSENRSTGHRYWYSAHVLVKHIRILVQATGTGTAHRYRYSTLVLVQRTGTGTAYLYWYCKLLLVKRTATDTMHQNWYNALVLVEHTGTAQRDCAYMCLAVSFYQLTFGAGCRGFCDVLAVSLHY